MYCHLFLWFTVYNSDFIVCDGTFEMAPDTYYQVYTLHGYMQGEALVLAWALLPNSIPEQIAAVLLGTVRGTARCVHPGFRRCRTPNVPD